MGILMLVSRLVGWLWRLLRDWLAGTMLRKRLSECYTTPAGTEQILIFLFSRTELNLGEDVT